MKTMLLRIRNMLFTPAREWNVILHEQTSAGNPVKRYGAVMAAIPPCAALLERLVFGGNVAGRQPLAVVLATNLVWYPVIIANMIITAAVFTVIIRRKDRRLIDLQGVQLAVYSFTPLFLVSALTMVPGLYWCTYAAILYSVYLLYIGIRVTTGAGQRTALWHVVASCFVAGVIVGSLNAVEYLAESFVATKVFF